MKALLFLFFPAFLFGQNTNPAVSDSIWTQLDALGYDSLVQTYDSFYDDNGDLYVYLIQIPGGQFKAISHTLEPNVFSFTDNTLTKSWHSLEMDNWLLGATGTNYEGYGCSGTVIQSCTITISGDTWTGEVTSADTAERVNALGLAFYHFLIDPDFATYLQ